MTAINFKQAQACFFHDQCRALLRLLLVAFVMLCSACDNSSTEADSISLLASAEQLHDVSGPIMGTSYAVKWANTPLPNAEKLILETLERINSLMSTYDPNSELSRFNQSPVGEWFQVSAETMATLEVARTVNEASEGALDVTVGALVNLWGFGPEGRITHEPTQSAIDKALKASGFDKLEIDVATSKIRKTADIYVDLSAVAKGYAVDVVAELLENRGIDNYLVDIGGELKMAGLKPDGSQWRIAIEVPRTDAREIFEVLSFEKAAVATSGDYRNYFEEDGVRYSHTIDPRTGRPIQHALVSVSIVSERCAVADAWATALMAVGPETAKILAQSQNLAVLLIMKGSEGFDAWSSPELEKLHALQAEAPVSDKP